MLSKHSEFKIKLIIPPWFEDYRDFFAIPMPFFPYGIAVLTAFLRKSNFWVEQDDLAIKFNHFRYDCYFLTKRKLSLDLYKYKNDIYRYASSLSSDNGKLDALIQKVLDSTDINDFNLVGFSISAFRQFIFAILLSKKIKERTNIPIVFGGFFVTLYGHLYPEAFKFVDYMVIGDGQVPLLKLINHLKQGTSISAVPNLIYSHNGKLMANPTEYFPIEDMLAPDFDGLSISAYKSTRFEKNVTLPYQITRGCISRCSFCVDRNKYEKIEFKSYNKVISELREMKQRYSCNKFILCDLTINNSIEYLDGLLGSFIKSRLNIIWEAYAKIDSRIDKLLLKKIKEAGCFALHFGIESGSDRMLKMMNKGFTSEEASKIIRDAHEFKINIHLGFMAGYPHETQQDINRTIEFIRKNRKYIYFSRVTEFVLMHGSPIYNNPDSYKITNLLPSCYMRHMLSFDELNGLAWSQIKRRNTHYRRRVLKAIYKFVLLKPRSVFLYLYIIPYFLYFLYVLVKPVHENNDIKSIL